MTTQFEIQGGVGKGEWASGKNREQQHLFDTHLLLVLPLLTANTVLRFEMNLFLMENYGLKDARFKTFRCCIVSKHILKLLSESD